MMENNLRVPSLKEVEKAYKLWFDDLISEKDRSTISNAYNENKPIDLSILNNSEYYKPARVSTPGSNDGFEDEVDFSEFDIDKYI